LQREIIPAHFLRADRSPSISVGLNSFSITAARLLSRPTSLRLDILDTMIRNIAVFCASVNGSNPAYRNAAKQLGQALAVRGIGIIYGGANVGLMQAVAESALAVGGKVIGVIPEVLVDLEVAHHGVTELHVTSTMHTRKALIGEKADAFIALPGGFGTFEELFEVLAWHTLKLHAKPILLLNINGFYDKLLDFLEHCVSEGMLKSKSREVIFISDTVEGALTKLQLDMPAAASSPPKYI
jgi:uncharacterized protein (TIGR00730 family)